MGKKKIFQILLFNILVVLVIYSLINFRLLWGDHSFKKDYTVGRYQVVYFVNGNFEFKDHKLIVYGKLIVRNAVIRITKFLVMDSGEVHAYNTEIPYIGLSGNSKAFLKDNVSLCVIQSGNTFLNVRGGEYTQILFENQRKLSISKSKVKQISQFQTVPKGTVYVAENFYDSYNFYRIEDFTKLGRRNYGNWGGIYDFLESDNGLSLPVGGRGSLVYRFEKDKPLESLFMKLWFSAEENSVTVSWENGRKIETIIRNKCYKGESIDLTKYLKNSKFILLNFSAENRGIEQEVILEKIIFYGKY